VAVAEQRRQQHLLGGAGVLVLVEQHHAAGRPLELADLGAGPGELGGERDHVAEVEQLAVALERGVARHDGQQLLARRLQVDRLPRGAQELARARGRRPQVVPDPQHGGRLDEVLGEIARQREDGLHHGRLGPGDGVHRAVVGADRPCGQLPAGRRGDEPRAGLAPERRAWSRTSRAAYAW
jgi:hypothetical protein